MTGRRSKRAKTEAANEAPAEVEAPSGGARTPTPPPARPSSSSLPLPWVAELWGPLEPAAAEACSRGALEVGLSGGRSSATRLFHRYPLRLIVPKRVTAGSDADCVWCYSVTFGGGLVAGDRSGMSADVAEGRAAVLSTQGTTKVYKHAGRTADSETDSATMDGDWAYSADDAKTRRETLQTLAARVAPGGLLASLPDPVQAFRGSRFRQTQKIALARDASVVVVDWIVAGRAAFRGGGVGGFTSGRGGGLAPSEDPNLRVEGGERWRFESYASETEVLLDGEAFAVESVSLRGEDPGGGTLAERMGATHALATAIIAGPRAAAAARRAREVAAPIVEAMARGGARGVAGGGEGGWMLASVSNLPATGADAEATGVILRLAGPDTDAVYGVLREALAPLKDEIGAPPFGERGLS